MDLSPGEQIELRKRIAATLSEREWSDILLILDEFGFETVSPDEWGAEAYVRAMTKGQDAERLSRLDEWLHPTGMPMSDSDTDTENTPFTDDEQLEIATKLADMKSYMETTHGLSMDQMETLEGRLKYLQEAAGRMGRVDWRNATAGVFLGMIVNVTLPGDVARDALVTLLRSMSHMFGHPIPELPAGI